MKTIQNRYGVGFVDSGVKILIAVVIGALMLSGLYAVTKDTILPSTKEKVESLFSYSGTNDSTSETESESEPSFGIRYISSTKLNSNGDVAMIFELPYSDYDYFEVDGNVIMDRSSGAWASDSDPGLLYLMLENKYIKSLSVGTHTVTAYSKDGGFGEVNFEIQ